MRFPCYGSMVRAGIGKTRLLQQATIALRNFKAIPIHICLYPNATVSIIDLLADTIAADPQLTSLLISPVSRRFPSVLETVRRLARLRPIVLILEDVHLTDENSTRELSRLLQALSHEPIAVICAARPNRGNAYSTILPYLSETVDLLALEVSDLQTLLEEYELRVDQRELAESLHRTTRGNPFIIKATLHDLLSAATDTLTDTKDFITSLIQESASVSIEGLVASFVGKFSAEERKAVDRLTILGELFSLEAAEALLPDAEEMIERLTAHGVISKSLRAMRPLCGQTTSAYPFVFTHSLLYEQLARQATYSELDLMNLFESQAALYSIVPFARIGTIRPQVRDSDQICRTFDHLTIALDSLDWSHVPNKLLSNTLVTHIERFYEKRKDILSQEKQTDCYLDLLSLHLKNYRTSWNHQDQARYIEEYLRLTASPTTAYRSIHRCLAYHHYIWNDKGADVQSSIREEILTDAQNLAKEYPEIVQTRLFIQLIGTILFYCKFSFNRFQQIRDYLLSIISNSTDKGLQPIIERAYTHVIHRWGLLDRNIR